MSVFEKKKTFYVWSALINQNNLINETTTYRENVFQGVRRVLIPWSRNNATHNLILLPWFRKTMQDHHNEQFSLCHLHGNPACSDFWMRTYLCVCVCVCVCVRAQSLSCVPLFAIPWTVAHQAPLSMEFSRQEYCMGCLFLLQGIFPTQGSNLCLLHLLYWWILYHWTT